MIEAFEVFSQIFWLVFVLGGAGFILATIWNLYTENKRREDENNKGDAND